MKLLLLNPSRQPLRKKWCERWVQALARRLIKRGYTQVKGKELVMVFVSSTEIRRLNRLYRRKDYSTDILSFQPAEDTSLGELVMCRSYIRRQAKRTGLGEYGELGYMIVHGVLHLLGHDHEKPKERDLMFALQDELFAELKRALRR
jgi:probable rRNA maturation factor